MKQVTWKRSCASVSSGAPNNICKILQTGGKQAVRTDLRSAVHLLSMRAGCQSLRPNGQTRPRWSDMNQYSVTVMLISRLKCFQNHLVVYGLAVKWESLWRGRHCEICWRNAKFRSHDRSTANRNALSMKWPVIGQSLPSRARFFKGWKQSHDEVQKSSYFPEHLNYNMLKGYYGIFAQWCQTYTAYCHFNAALGQMYSFWDSNII